MLGVKKSRLGCCCFLSQLFAPWLWQPASLLTAFANPSVLPLPSLCFRSPGLCGEGVRETTVGMIAPWKWSCLCEGCFYQQGSSTCSGGLKKISAPGQTGPAQFGVGQSVIVFAEAVTCGLYVVGLSLEAICSSLLPVVFLR